MMSQLEKDFLLGLDIGTSSIKLAIIDGVTHNILLELNKSTQAAQIVTEDKLRNEQNVDVILEVLNNLFKQISHEQLLRIKAVQLCGQMHGVVCWNSQTKEHSNLVTWQDGRCSPEFLSSLPVTSKSDLNSGFGCATLFWYSLNFGEDFFQNYDSSGTIHDFISFLLGGKSSISVHNSVSWGYFDWEKSTWQYDLLVSKQFPVKILPNVLKPGAKISNSVNLLNNNIHLENTPIYVALGDLQCSVHSCLEFDYDCVINISTSSQLCIAVNVDRYQQLKSTLPSSISVFSYYQDKVLLVAASLNGGNVLVKFIELLIEWNTLFGFQDDSTNFSNKEYVKNRLWSKLLILTEDWCNKNSHQKLRCKPLLYGERHAKTTFASIENISIESLSIGEIFSSICFGIIENLTEMFPLDILVKQLGCKRVVATGSALLRNNILKLALQRTFKDLDVLYKATGDAAIGAAYFLKTFS